MSTGRPIDPVCDNITAAIISSPTRVNAVAVAFDPVCRTDPTTDTQTAVPDLPPAR